MCTGTYTLTQADVNSGRVTNTATVDRDQTPPTNVPSDVTITEVPALTLVEHDTLDMTKAAPASRADVGDRIDYTLTATNAGNVTLTGVTITDPKLSVLTCTPAQPVTLQPGAQLVCTGSSTLTQADLDNGRVVNVATADSVESPPAGAASNQDLTQQPAVTLVKRGVLDMTVVAPNTRPDAGDMVVYAFAITVVNTGSSTLSNVSVSDPRAPGCSRTSATAPALASMAPGESVTYRCSLRNVRASFTNVATTTGTGSNGARVTDSSSASVTVVRPAAGLAISKGPASQTIAQGGVATFEITVTNTGGVPLTSVTVRDPRAPECNRVFATLAVGQSKSYTCTHAGVTAGFRNVATVTARSPGGVLGAVKVSRPVQVKVAPPEHPGIAIVNGPKHRPLATPTTAGGATTRSARFKITVTNTGNVTLRGVKVADLLTPTCNTTLGTLGPGRSRTCSCTRPPVSIPYVNAATASGTSPSGTTVRATDYAFVVKPPSFLG